MDFYSSLFFILIYSQSKPVCFLKLKNLFLSKFFGKFYDFFLKEIGVKVKL